MLPGSNTFVCNETGSKIKGVGLYGERAKKESPVERIDSELRDKQVS